ncbi:MAG: hypothetical protein J1G02_02875 [Clostridiales bacterium]|nr:hypothetical protein [Clostridiales bacterium]
MSKSQNKMKQGTALTVLLMAIIATILIIIFVVFALIFAPKSSIPEFEITDQDGGWKAQGEIAVFDDKIKPGSEGTYKFIIKNESDYSLRYGFKLSEYIGNINQNSDSFMQYRLKVDNVPIDDEWHYAGLDYNNIEILPSSKHIMTLEWRWPFENDRDGNDTVVGRAEGQLSVWMFLWAEVIYD